MTKQAVIETLREYFYMVILNCAIYIFHGTSEQYSFISFEHHTLFHPIYIILYHTYISCYTFIKNSLKIILSYVIDCIFKFITKEIFKCFASYVIQLIFYIVHKICLLISIIILKKIVYVL
jgi:hypothetical protein